MLPAVARNDIDFMEFNKSSKNCRMVGNPVLLSFRKASNIKKWKGKREVEEKWNVMVRKINSHTHLLPFIFDQSFL